MYSITVEQDARYSGYWEGRRAGELNWYNDPTVPARWTDWTRVWQEAYADGYRDGQNTPNIGRPEEVDNE